MSGPNLCSHGNPGDAPCNLCTRDAIRAQQRAADERLVAFHQAWYGPDEGDAILLADDSPEEET